jgi:hypothetical protein
MLFRHTLNNRTSSLTVVPKFVSSPRFFRTLVSIDLFLPQCTRRSRDQFCQKAKWLSSGGAVFDLDFSIFASGQYDWRQYSTLTQCLNHSWDLPSPSQISLRQPDLCNVHENLRNWRSKDHHVSKSKSSCSKFLLCRKSS